jgi:hypothetical protein
MLMVDQGDPSTLYFPEHMGYMEGAGVKTGSEEVQPWENRHRTERMHGHC